nr:MAG TPA: hypothetical protein [Bacteriophage sp.]DAY36606.1 MAG TPA: hypothetical protein [Bacteriophage sp.]
MDIKSILFTLVFVFMFLIFCLIDLYVIYLYGY